MSSEAEMSLKRQQREYDAAAKRLFANKQVAANILKYTVSEFEGYSLSEIISCIDGEPAIGTEEVDDILPMMDSAGAEAVSVDEGIRRFDVKFKVKTFKGQDIDLIINIEAQNSYHKNGYALEKRGFYYLSRMISSQYGVEFMNSDFDSLKKVYSIWICMNSPKEYANTITRYNIKPENVVGAAPDHPENYDVMSLVIVNLGKTDTNYTGLIKMVDVLFNQSRADTARNILQKEYGIDFRQIGKEESAVCNLSQGIWEQGKAEGVLQNALEVVKNLLSEGFSLEKALKIANIDRQTYDEYSKRFDS